MRLRMKQVMMKARGLGIGYTCPISEEEDLS